MEASGLRSPECNVHEDPHAHQDLRPFEGLAQSGIAVAGPPPRVLVRRMSPRV